jgi:hypothetical protein
VEKSIAGWLTVREVKVRKLVIVGPREARIVYALRSSPDGFSPFGKEQTFWPECRIAVLAGHGLGIAELSPFFGWSGRDEDSSWPELVGRARSCGAEMLFDNLGEVAAAAGSSPAPAGGSSLRP